PDVLVDPTVTHTLIEGHDTSDKSPQSAPGTTTHGLGRITQLLPFQRSTNSAGDEHKGSESVVPAAMQAVAEVQDTPRNSANDGGAGSGGVGWTDQLVPSHRSTSVP